MDKFLPYYLGIDLEEIGFNGEVLAFYNLMDSEHGIIHKYSAEFKELNKKELSPAPTWEEAFEWFLETKKMIVRAVPVESINVWEIKIESEGLFFGLDEAYSEPTETYTSYKEARYNAYKKAIEIFKK